MPQNRWSYTRRNLFINIWIPSHLFKNFLVLICYVRHSETHEASTGTINIIIWYKTNYFNIAFLNMILTLCSWSSIFTIYYRENTNNFYSISRGAFVRQISINSQNKGSWHFSCRNQFWSLLKFQILLISEFWFFLQKLIGIVTAFLFLISV